MKGVKLSSTSVPKAGIVHVTPATMPAAKMAPDLTPGVSAAKLGTPKIAGVPREAQRPRMRLRKLSMTGKSAFPTTSAAFSPTAGPAGPAQAFSGPAVISGAGDAGE